MDISSALSSFSNLSANLGANIGIANPAGANADSASTNRNEPATSSAIAQGRAESGIQVNISSEAQDALQRELNGQRVGIVSNQTELTYNNLGQLGNSQAAAAQADNAAAQSAGVAEDIRGAALDNLSFAFGDDLPQTSAVENAEREAVESIGGEVI